MTKRTLVSFILAIALAGTGLSAPKASPESVGLESAKLANQPRPETKFGLRLGIDPAPGKSGNLFGWGGAAGTRFWLDPERDMITIFGTQLYPGGGKREAEVRDDFLKLVYESVSA